MLKQKMMMTADYRENRVRVDDNGYCIKEIVKTG